MLEWQEFPGISQMPFAENGCGISFRFQEFGNSFFLVAYTSRGVWVGGVGKTYTVGITSCHKAGAGCTTDGLYRVEIGHGNSFGRQFVDMGSLISHSSLEREVAVSGIVQIDQDDIQW